MRYEIFLFLFLLLSINMCFVVSKYVHEKERGKTFFNHFEKDRAA